MSREAHKRILVAVETERRNFSPGHHETNKLLDTPATAQLLAHLTADLDSLFPAAGRCRLSMAGALYDLCQVLRPGFPLYGALGETLAHSNPATRLVACGAEEGVMPLPALQPESALPAGPMRILPLLLSGKEAHTDELFDAMEHRFLEQGQVSAHSAKGLEAAFGIRAIHARFMTRTDLCAMLRMQLEQVGFLPLWELLDAALGNFSDPLEATGQRGVRFNWRQGAVHGYFETFDEWAVNGAGSDLPAEPPMLADAYAAWTREYRQYLLVLQAHRVPVEQFRACDPGASLPGTYFVESSQMKLPARPARVTEHSAGDLGTIAVTTIENGRQYNYYPLWPAGLNDLHGHIRDQGLASGGVAYPGTVLYHPADRRLVPDRIHRA